MPSLFDEKPKEKNVLEIIQNKITTIKNKKLALTEQLEGNQDEILKIKENIEILQKNLLKVENLSTEASQTIDSYDKILSEMETGYHSLIESGNVLLNIIDNS